MADVTLDGISEKQDAPKKNIRLARTFFIAAFISIALAEIFWLIPAMLTREQQLYEETERRARIAITAMIEEARFEDVALTKRIGERLMAIGDIKGAAIYDRFGNRINTFGEQPVLSWIGASQENNKRYIDPTHCCLDIYMPSEETGLSDNLILRLDISETRYALYHYLVDLAWTVFIVATITCGAAVLQLYFWVAMPIKHLATASIRAAEKPWLADDYLITLKRSDEMGDLAKASNKLFKSVAKLYRNEFHIAKQLLSKSSHAVLQFTNKGDLIQANPKALSMFKAPSLARLQSKANIQFRCPRINPEKPIGVLELMSGQKNIIACGFVKVGDEEIRCVISGTIVQDIKDDFLHYTIVILPAEEHTQEIMGLHRTIDGLETQIRSMRTGVGENKIQGESSRMLVQVLNDKFGVDEAAHKNPEPFDCVEALTGWSTRVKKMDVPVVIEFPQQLPSLIGNPKILKNIFEQVAVLIFLRSEYAEPVLAVTANKPKKGNGVTFIIEDVSKKKNRAFLAKGMKRKNAEVALMTLQKLLPMANGQILSGLTSSFDKNEITIKLDNMG